VPRVVLGTCLSLDLPSSCEEYIIAISPVFLTGMESEMAPRNFDVYFEDIRTRVRAAEELKQLLWTARALKMPISDEEYAAVDAMLKIAIASDSDVLAVRAVDFAAEILKKNRIIDEERLAKLVKQADRES
jgi:hypothetical protein